MSKSVPVVLEWQTAEHDPERERAKTRCLSRYGCTVLCDTRVRPAKQITLVDAARDKSATARVVYRELTGRDHELILALEFMENGDFWEMEFPPAGSGDARTDRSGRTRFNSKRR